eukprot:1343034-Pleurochrysis_carterae.AAC.1
MPRPDALCAGGGIACSSPMLVVDRPGPSERFARRQALHMRSHERGVGRFAVSPKTKPTERRGSRVGGGGRKIAWSPCGCG